MGLLEQEIKELRTLNNQLVKGKITTEAVHARISIYSQTEKRAKMLLQAIALAAKHKHIVGRIVKSNLIGDREAIDINFDKESEKVKCPYKNDSLITRSECLDFSGSGKIPECDGCEIGNITREKLLD